MDAIRLTGMSFYGYHGVRPEERALGQRFVVDVRLELPLWPAGRSDDLAESVDYGLVWHAVQAVVEGPPVKLIERLAEQVAATLLAQFDRVARVTVRVQKPWAPIAGAHLGSVSAELSRSRDDPDHKPAGVS